MKISIIVINFMKTKDRLFNTVSLKAMLIIAFAVTCLPLVGQRTTLMFAKSDGRDTDTRFMQYADELAAYDLSITMPEGFHAIDMRGRRYINRLISNNWPTSGILMNELPQVAVEADNNEAVFLFPECLIPGNDPKMQFVPMSQMVKCGSLIETELRYNRNDSLLDVRPLINIICEEDMTAYANADTAVVYSFDFKTPFLDQYRHCIGIYLRKYGHTPLLLKIAFNKAGLADKDKYIRLLLDNVTYGDKPDANLIKCEAINHEDLDFPSAPKKSPGIIDL